MEQFRELSENKTEKQNGKLKFFPDQATLLLNINERDLAFKELENTALKKGLFRKEEVHLTLLGSKNGEAILVKLNALPEEQKTSQLAKIKEIAETFSWKVVVKPECYYISKKYNDPDPNDLGKTIPETRESIVQMLEVEDLEEFYRAIREFTGIDFDLPLSHATLYTNSTRQDKRLRGIGIYSEKQFNELNPEKITV